MGEFKFGVLFIILTRRRNSVSELSLMQKIIESLDPEICSCKHNASFMRDSRQTSRIKGGYKDGNIPRVNRENVLNADFKQQLENIRTRVLPLIAPAQKNIEHAILQLLEDDETIEPSVFIGPAEERFQKKSILEQSLEFDELLTGSLHYTIAHFERYTADRDQVRKYIDSILVLPEEKAKQPLGLIAKNIKQGAHNENVLLDKVRCKSYLKIGYLLSTTKEEDFPEDILGLTDEYEEDLNDNDDLFDDENSILKILKLINTLENAIGFLETASYKSFCNSIIDFYKNHNPNYHSLILIGFCIGHMNTNKAHCFDLLNSIQANFVSDGFELLNFINLENEQAYDIEVKYEHIYNYLINQGISTNNIANTEHINHLIDLFNDNCCSLNEAKNIAELLIEENKIIDNKEVLLVLEAFEALWQQTPDDKTYKMCLKYRLWPFSLWEENKLFDGACMDNIRVIVRRATTRSEAIKLAEISLDISKKVYNERDIQVFARVAYEFNIASDREFAVLKQIEENDRAYLEGLRNW